MDQSTDLKDSVFDMLTESPKHWVFSEYRASHVSGVQFWTGNGLLFFAQEGDVRVTIGLVNWLKLFFWLKRARNYQVINSTTENQ